MESIRISRFLLAVGAVLLALAFWGAWGLWQYADAHPIGWKWNTSNHPLVSNFNTPYNDEIQSTVDDYDSNTDLSVDSCNQPCSESILHILQYVGSADWAAAADSYSNGQQCNVDITCNETTNKVTSGVVVWNSAHGTYSESYANYLARHEMGHIFGLAHAPCHTEGDYGGGAYYSVLAISCPYAAKDELQDHDIDDINDKY